MEYILVSLSGKLELIDNNYRDKINVKNIILNFISNDEALFFNVNQIILYILKIKMRN